jgi:glycosyltransferase involved in cell wall biosynthesis
MRICFVMAGLPHYFKLVLNKLATDYGVEVILIKPSQKGQSVGSGVQEDADGLSFKLIELAEYKTWYGKAFFKELLPTLSNIKPDVVVMSAWPYFMQFVLNPAFYLGFKKLKTKLICRDIPFNIAEWGKVRDYYYSNQNLTEDFRTEKKTLKGFLAFWGISALRRVYLPLADAHINYIDEAYNIMGSYGVPKQKIFVTANSPDTDELLVAFEEVKKRALILPQNPYRLIHVGRLVKWKRVDLIIEAVRNLQTKFDKIELVVVGYGPDEDNLKKLSIELGVQAKVLFVGGVYNSADLGQYLHASAIYVLGGMGGLSINDAMCFGKPVVCSVADGTEKRLMRENENGFYFENSNAESLTKVLDTLLSDQNKITQFGQKSSEIIEKEINIHTVLQGYIQAFQFALQS